MAAGTWSLPLIVETWSSLRLNNLPKDRRPRLGPGENLDLSSVVPNWSFKGAPLHLGQRGGRPNKRTEGLPLRPSMPLAAGPSSRGDFLKPVAGASFPHRRRRSEEGILTSVVGASSSPRGRQEIEERALPMVSARLDAPPGVEQACKEKKTEKKGLGGKVFVVFGGGGYVGSRLCLELAAMGASEVRAFDRFMDRSVSELLKERGIVCFLGDSIEKDEIVSAVRGADCVFLASPFGASDPKNLFQRDHLHFVNLRDIQCIVECCQGLGELTALIYSSPCLARHRDWGVEELRVGDDPGRSWESFAGPSSRLGTEDTCEEDILGAENMETCMDRNGVAELLVLNAGRHCGEGVSSSSSDAYSLLKGEKSKCQETNVLAGELSSSAGRRLRTCVLRLPFVYGPEEREHLPSVMALIRWGLFFPVGDGSLLQDFVHVANVVEAHVLAYLALAEEEEQTLDSGRKRQGSLRREEEDGASRDVQEELLRLPVKKRCYYISDGEPPINFFEFYRPLVVGLGRSLPSWRLPSSLAFAAETVARRSYLFLLSCLPKALLNPVLIPADMYRLSLADSRPMSISDPAEDLSYVPVVSRDEGMTEIVKHCRSRVLEGVEGPIFWEWVAISTGLLITFLVGYAPLGSLGSFERVRDVGLLLFGSVEMLRQVFWWAFAIHVVEACIAWALARQIEPHNSTGWFLQTFWLVLFNLYGPRVEPGDDVRFKFKLNFFVALQCRWDLLLSKGRRVVVVGDLNISPFRIDTCSYGPDFDLNLCRQWLHSNLKSGHGDSDKKFVDVFRQMHPFRKKAYTCWSQSSGAEEFDYGSRIDLILAAGPCTKEGIMHGPTGTETCGERRADGGAGTNEDEHSFFDCEFLHCEIMTALKRWKGGGADGPDAATKWGAIKLEGSDHVPVYAVLKDQKGCGLHRVPSSAARYMPEIRGRQQNIACLLLPKVNGTREEACLSKNEQLGAETKLTTAPSHHPSNRSETVNEVDLASSKRDSVAFFAVGQGRNEENCAGRGLPSGAGSVVGCNEENCAGRRLHSGTGSVVVRVGYREGGSGSHTAGNPSREGPPPLLTASGTNLGVEEAGAATIDEQGEGESEVTRSRSTSYVESQVTVTTAGLAVTATEWRRRRRNVRPTGGGGIVESPAIAAAADLAKRTSEQRGVRQCGFEVPLRHQDSQASMEKGGAALDRRSVRGGGRAVKRQMKGGLQSSIRSFFVAKEESKHEKEIRGGSNPDGLLAWSLASGRHEEVVTGLSVHKATVKSLMKNNLIVAVAMDSNTQEGEQLCPECHRSTHDKAHKGGGKSTACVEWRDLGKGGIALCGTHCSVVNENATKTSSGLPESPTCSSCQMAEEEKSGSTGVSAIRSRATSTPLQTDCITNRHIDDVHNTSNCVVDEQATTACRGREIEERNAMTRNQDVSDDEPAGTCVKYNEPAGTRVKYDGPAGTRVKYDEPAGTHVRYDEPAGTRVTYNGMQKEDRVASLSESALCVPVLMHEARLNEGCVGGGSVKEGLTDRPTSILGKRSVTAHLDGCDGDEGTGSGNGVVEVPADSVDICSVPSSGSDGTGEPPARKKEGLVFEASGAVTEWQKLRSRMQMSVPLCNGHKEACAFRVVKKVGPNVGRGFYVCARSMAAALKFARVKLIASRSRVRIQ
ncbi:hypothetical protein CBR_g18710 [Chara braunii]|uniref:GRF-type domain-containing protein n=1 Tax=Chara braunii TaxID=69332 RepID=A0A388KW65_CHABU|nr:hypothetical protein CBR_g18710 [Chara braunii]|eukprot:GBG74299.1 hypothetical protein CBR_g18710 [Chara braunii]